MQVFYTLVDNMQVFYTLVDSMEMEMQQAGNRPPPLSSQSLAQILISVYRHQPGAEQLICIICLAEINDGERVKVLPCQHTFHDKCINAWLWNVRIGFEFQVRAVSIN
jgi:hypothetical protein